MYIEAVPNRGSPPAILLRESYRDGGKVKKRTLANLSKLPPPVIDGLRRLLRGEALVAPDDAIEIVRSRPHGHVVAVLGTVRRLGLDRILFRRAVRQRHLVVAMIVGRILEPRSKLATARGLGNEAKLNTLGEMLGIEEANENELYAAMDWVLARQGRIEAALARRHLEEGCLIFYDLTSTYFEGRTCPLAALGHSRDGQRGKLQIVWGLLCNVKGCPVAVEVFKGNTADPRTLATQIEKVRTRFGLRRVVFVGDRGMITDARIRDELRPAGLDWITALRAPAIQKLADKGAIPRSLFDEVDLAEISAPEYPGERLVICRHPILAEERRRKREALLQATERELDKIIRATMRKRRPLRGKANIGLRVGKVINRYKVAKHFTVTIGEDRFEYERKTEKIAREAALDGIYVVRTSVPRDPLPAPDTVRAYKSLTTVERAFRSLKTVDLKVRPIHHRLADRVRAHVFLCMLAYYVEWHMRQALAPMLFDDEDHEAMKASAPSPVAPAQRSPKALQKASRKRTENGQPVHSFQTLLDDLATLTTNRVRPRVPGAVEFDMLATPTPLQQRALDLLGVSLKL